MNGIARVIDGMIAAVAPQFALKRTAARHKMQILNRKITAGMELCRRELAGRH